MQQTASQQLPKRRDRKWWKERWVAGHYAKLRSSGLLVEFMKDRNHNSASLARLAAIQRQAESGRGVSRQMISYMVNGKVTTCEPDLAAAIERVLNVPPHVLFEVLPKSRDTRHNVKGRAA